MSAILLLATGTLFGVIVTMWLMRRWPATSVAGDLTPARHLAIARVLLHQARRRRQLAQLERHMAERARQRLDHIDRVDWLES